MRILKHPIIQLIFLSLPPLVVTLLQVTRLDFPSTDLAAVPFNPWPRLIFNALLLCVAQGLIFWLLMRAGQSGWLGGRSTTARMALRFVLAGIGLVVLLLLIVLAVAQVFTAWSTAQVINNLSSQPNLEAVVETGGKLAAVEIVIVGAVWSALFANWYMRIALAAERKHAAPA